MSVVLPPVDVAAVAPVEKPAAGRAEKGDLAETFGKALADARNLEGEANRAAERFAAGDASMGIHEVMIASEKANLALRFATTLKNKAVDAYRELMNTQV